MVLVPAFRVGGFRSFYGPPQLVGPLSKVTVIAGPNNSGKSNILAAAKLLKLAEAGEGRVDPLDLPDLVDDQRVSLTLGSCVDLGSNVVAAMREQLNWPLQGTQGSVVMEGLVQHEAFAPLGAEAGIVCRDYEWSGSQFVPGQWQIAALETASPRAVLYSGTRSRSWSTKAPPEI